MKIIKRDYKHGVVTLIPENSDDLYSIYRILKPGDKLKATTSRRIRRKDEDGRQDSGERIKMTLEIEVEEFAFHGFGDNLRIKGKITAGPENLISLGTYHTIAVKPMEKVTITKEKWSQLEAKILEDAEKASMLAQILILTVEDDSACVAFVTQFSIKIIAEFSAGATRKFSDVKQHSSDMGQFFKETYEIVKEADQQYQPKIIIVAGPGFTPEEFYDFVKKRDPVLFKKIRLVHTNTGGRVGLSEVLSRKLPEKIAEEQRVAYEMRLMEEVMKRIGKDTGTVTYGIDKVKNAIEMGAVETLLISDDMLRLDDLNKRELIDRLVEQNRKMRGTTVIFSVLHETGKQLSSLGGVVALLRYPLRD